MDLKKIDKKSRDMLLYLNTNTKLSSATLADAFNQHYKTDLEDAIETLFFLESMNLVKVKTQNNRYVIIIQVTHLGRTYEEELAMQEKERQQKIRSDRLWNIITLLLSTVLSIMINLIMK